MNLQLSGKKQVQHAEAFVWPMYDYGAATFRTRKKIRVFYVEYAAVAHVYCEWAKGLGMKHVGELLQSHN